MRKALFLLLIVSTLILSGCIDVYQHITRNSNGNTDIYLKCTISKALFAAAKSFSGDGDSVDYEDLLDIDENLSALDSNGFTIIEQGKIDSDTDFGYYAKTSINSAQEKLIKNDARFTPHKVGNKTVLYLNSSSTDNSTNEDSPFAQALLSSAKYRLTIEKTFLKKISKVYLDYEDDIPRMIDFVDLSDAWLIEIPMIYILYNSSTQLIIE